MYRTGIVVVGCYIMSLSLLLHFLLYSLVRWFVHALACLLSSSSLYICYIIFVVDVVVAFY